MKPVPLYKNFLYFAYGGTSMAPTLEEPDLLEVLPYGMRPILKGDVIFFRNPDRLSYTVHRVMEVSRDGIRTRGDRLSSPDPWLLSPLDVVGQVVAASRGEKRRRLAGGPGGIVAGSLARWRNRIRRWVYPGLHGIYDILWIWHQLLCGRWKPRVIGFQSDSAIQLRLFIGRRAIGFYALKERRWHIRPLFRLLIDEATLPNPEDIQLKMR